MKAYWFGDSAEDGNFTGLGGLLTSSLDVFNDRLINEAIAIFYDVTATFCFACLSAKPF
jgi:hypothetical protein